MIEPNASVGAKAHRSEAGNAASHVDVWDPLVRVFHWTVVTGSALDYFLLTDGETAHQWIGYVVGAALISRVAWGFYSRGHAAFASFIRDPRTTSQYVAKLASGRAPRHIGHNPAAAVMIVTLMAVLAVIVTTGWMQTTDPFWGVGWVQNAHVWAANGLLALVVIHATFAVAESVRHRENLIWSMVTGRKRAEDGANGDGRRDAI